VTLEHYAEVWTTEGDGCYRYVAEPGTTRPMRCPHEPVWIGRHLDGGGVWRKVRSCDGHRAGLEHARRLH
jgi:hypothetical protein